MVGKTILLVLIKHSTVPYRIVSIATSKLSCPETMIALAIGFISLIRFNITNPFGPLTFPKS